MERDQLSLTALARAGFADLDAVRPALEELTQRCGMDGAQALSMLAEAADPDEALRQLLALLRLAPDRVGAVVADPARGARVARLLGASPGLGDFFLRHPEELAGVGEPMLALPDAGELRADLLDAVGAVDGFAAITDEGAWDALRVRYRRRLAWIAEFDLGQRDPARGLEPVAQALADLAAAALEASLAVARAHVAAPDGGRSPGTFPRDEVRRTRFSVIGMGKAGAAELNYLSDVDVIFVAAGDDEPPLGGPAAAADGARGGASAEPGLLTAARAVDIATRLAILMMRGINAPSVEPGLWEVDPNLRPEGKDGALVRTLESHLAYYERWAQGWEFQALLKARPLAGDLELGRDYVRALAPKVWASSSRENFVESVQRMRERVTDNIPDDELDYQLKLGPGGLRDIEFTVQLLQLVHGQSDDRVRQRATLPALAALSATGYIGRPEAAEFSDDYRILRLMEHRLQLRHLRRTHLMPRDEADVRVLARSTGLAATAGELIARWSEIKARVRGLHERLFYRPLLSAVAALPSDERGLTSSQAEARLAAIGFRNPAGALSHIAALTGGVSRRAEIQRHLLPVMLQWFAAGADPDYGLLVFRRLSEELGSTHWFLRMLRDSAGAAERLTRVLSGSRYAGELLGRIPESVGWFDSEDELRPRPAGLLGEETRAILARHDQVSEAAASLRAMRRREVLRLALSAILGLCTLDELASGLSDVTENHISGILTAVREGRPESADLEFAVIAMGRFGGRELGFGSDADVLYVFRTRDGAGLAADRAVEIARSLVADLNRHTEDSALPLDLDIGLRPEGKNGPPVRSLDSYRAYYARWSLTWEAQALLRARAVAGDRPLADDFHALADTVRYPLTLTEQDVREVKRIKARVENERLPQGADPTRHLKLGRGSLSDVEWLVQLMQLQHASSVPELKTTSTLRALRVLVEHGLVDDSDAERLGAAWVFASRARSAMTLWTNKTSDVLPVDRAQLEGIARLMEYPPHSASALEEDYLAVTRRARSVFDRLFYGE